MFVLKNQQKLFDPDGIPHRLREICNLFIENRVFQKQEDIAKGVEISKSTFDRLISPDVAPEKLNLEKLNNFCSYPIGGKWIDPIWLVCGEVTSVGMENLLDESIPLEDRIFTAMECIESFTAIHGQLVREKLASDGD